MRQGRRLLWGTAVAVIAVAIAGVAPAAASRRGCEKAVGSHTLANSHSVSGQAIVLRKSGKLYGCVFKKPRKNQPLPGQDGKVLSDSIVVNGRYAAYGSHFGDPENTIVFSVRLWKFRTDDQAWAV